MTEPTEYRRDDDEEIDIEAPEADALEQHAESYDSGEEEGATQPSREVPLEADPADAADQDRSAGAVDEDDYR